MKYAAIAGLLLASAAANQNKAADVKKYVQITEGILMGTIHAEGLTDIEHCIQDGEHLLQDAEKAYQDFSKKNIDGMIAGIKDVADAIKFIKAAMKDCSAAKEDWEKLEKMATTFGNPVSFAWHVADDIVHNGVKITKEVEAGIQDYKDEDWYGFGFNFGEAAAQVFLGAESQAHLAELEKNKQMAMFYQGFSKAFNLKFDIFDLLVCVQYADQSAEGLYISYLAMEKAIHDTDRMDMIGDILGSILGVYGAYKQYQQAVPWCERAFGSGQDITPMMDSMKFVENPLENLPTMTSNLYKYQDDIKEDTLSAMFYYKTEQYDKFGEFIGNVVRVISEQEAKAAEENNLFLY